MDLKKAHIRQNAEVYGAGLLNPDKHYVLVEKLAQYAREAGIPSKYIYRPIEDFCDDNPEVTWMKQYRYHRCRDVYGVCFVGSPHHLQRMSAMVGMCVRNYISSRLTDLTTLLTDLKDNNASDVDMLSVGNFCLGQMSGGHVPAWQIPALIGYLYKRYSSEQYTIVYVDDFANIKKIYGPTMSEHIEEYFDIING